jgi:hypothetical protein
LYRQVGDHGGLSYALIRLGWLTLRQGDSARAGALFEEGLNIGRMLEQKQVIAYAHHGLGGVALAGNDAAAARANYAQSLAAATELGDRTQIVVCLECLASLAARAENRPLRAARLWGAVQALHEVWGASIAAGECTPHEREIAQARAAAPNPEAFAAAWVEGQAMPWEQAVLYAMGRDEDNDPL